MPMLKAQKVEYAKKLSDEIASYKTAAIMPIDSIPDALLQRVRNSIKPEAKMIIARKGLLGRALGDERLKQLQGGMAKNFALILSNREPLELYEAISGSRMRLGAKPNQTAPSDIRIEPGDTNVAPGQTVTELKSAGVDVQIQKGKVVIAKGKVLVEKGKKISGAVANALKILGIKPFEVVPRLGAAVANGLVYGEAALAVNQEYIRAEILRDFGEAYALSLELGIPNEYNMPVLILRAHGAAIAIGIEGKILEPEIVSILMSNAAAGASELAKKIGVDAK